MDSTESRMFIAVRLEDAVINPDIELTLCDSTLKSTFVRRSNNETEVYQGRGVFTTDIIRAEDIIYYVDNGVAGNINDGMIDLTELVEAKNSKNSYIALCNLYNKYYDWDRASNVINVRKAMDNKGTYYQAIKDIHPGEELLMMYGFLYWIFNVSFLVTDKTAAGFAKFIIEHEDIFIGHQHEEKLQRLSIIFKGLLNQPIDLDSYDKNRLETDDVSLSSLFDDIEKNYDTWLKLVNSMGSKII